MLDFIGNAHRVAAIEGDARIYKRWLSTDNLLVMTHSVETSTYTTSLLVLSTGLIHPWGPDRGYRIKAQILPVTSFSVTGEVISRSEIYLQPRVFQSNDRSRLCWIDCTENWTVYDTQTDGFHRQPISEYHYVDRQAAWLPDGERFIMPIRTASGKRFSRFHTYSATGEEITLLRTPRVKSGSCLGCTLDSDVVTMSDKPPVVRDEQPHDCLLTVISIREDAVATRRHAVSIPAGWYVYCAALNQATAQLCLAVEK